MSQNPSQTEAVQNLQRYLRQLSYHDPAIPPPPVDGVFDTDTRAALRAYQDTRALPVTGSADRVTWERLFEDYRTSLALESVPLPVPFFDPRDDPATLLATGEDFRTLVLQYMLRELGTLFHEAEEVTLSGRYDAATQAAVRVLQAASDLPVTGAVDPPTWNLVTDLHATRLFREGVE